LVAGLYEASQTSLQIAKFGHLRSDDRKVALRNAAGLHAVPFGVVGQAKQYLGVVHAEPEVAALPKDRLINRLKRLQATNDR